MSNPMTAPTLAQLLPAARSGDAVAMEQLLRLCMRPMLAWLKAEPLAQVEDNLAWSHRPDHELRHDLALAIDSLPPLYREALLLRDFEELTIEEMAQRLGVTREAAKSRLHRARALVREYLVPSAPAAR